MGSMLSIQLRDAMSDSFAISLDPNCFKQYSTPRELKSFVMGNQGDEIKVDLPLLSSLDDVKLSPLTIGFIQLISSAVLLLMFTISIVPAWYTGKLFAKIQVYKILHALGTDEAILWFWFPFVILYGCYHSHF